MQNSLIQTDNTFNTFPEYKLESADSVSKRAIYANKQDSVDFSDKNETSDKKKVKYKSTIATSIITAAILSQVFVKGVHGSSQTNLSKLAEKLSADIQNMNIESTKDIISKTAFHTKKAAKKLIETLQSFSNFTAIKDNICDKILRTNKATSKFADKSRTGFRKIIDKTLGKKYDKVELNVKSLSSLLNQYNVKNLSNLSETQKLQQVTIKGTTKSLGEWIEILSSQTKNFETAYDDGFSLGARRLRNQKRLGLLSDISEKIDKRFFKNKGLFKPKNYKNYATEDVSKAAKKELKNDIIDAKNRVTNNIPNITGRAKGFINSLSDTIKPDDKASKEALQSIKQKLEEFSKCSGVNEQEARKLISNDISHLVDNAVETVRNNSSYSSSEQAKLIKQLKGIKTTALSATENSKGSLEKIMTILKGLNSQTLDSGKKIISDSEFNEFSRLSSQISKGLEKATNLEMEEYFLKQAELEVGSAPTDILSVLFPVGAGAYAINKGDDKDEKISAALTTCIPLVGTFAAFVFGTTRMFTGAKNLIFSAATGAVLSCFGNYCDKLYKEYKSSGSVSELAKEKRNNIWTNIAPNSLQTLEKGKNK